MDSNASSIRWCCTLLPVQCLNLHLQGRVERGIGGRVAHVCIDHWHEPSLGCALLINKWTDQEADDMLITSASMDQNINAMQIPVHQR